MKKFLKTVLVLGALLAPFAATASSVLWFSVSSSATVKDRAGNISTADAYADADGNPLNAARIRITGVGIPEDTFLRLYYEDGGWQTMEGLDTAILEEGAAAWQPADLGEDPDGSATVSLELGYLDLDDEASKFAAVAFASATLDDLGEAGYISTGGVSEQSQTPWNPAFFVPVPEPSAGLLLAFGACVLALRRRTGKEETR